MHLERWFPRQTKPKLPAINYDYDAAGNLVKDRQGGLKDIYWNLAGKVTTIVGSVGGKQIFYDYDGLGNRIYNNVVSNAGSAGESHLGEYYLRDAGSNILTTYQTNRVYKGTILALNQAIYAGDAPAYWSFLASKVAPL